MIRITTHDQAPVMSFVLEGKLVGPWVKELEKCWESALSADSSRAMLVNLASVTFIDSAGRALLARMRRQGVRLMSAGVFMNAIVAEIEAEERPKTAEYKTSKIEKEPLPFATPLARAQ
jgi:anti-anti-sigma regulatory factor